MGVMITMIPLGIFAVQRDLNLGLGDAAYSTLMGIIISGMLFLGFVITAILNRNYPDRHKRFMLLSTIIVLWPAWFRLGHYFPGIPDPEIWFALVLADSLIIVAWIWDKLHNGRIHPVLLYGGLFIIIEQSCEVIFFDSPVWRDLARKVYFLFL